MVALINYDVQWSQYYLLFGVIRVGTGTKESRLKVDKCRTDSLFLPCSWPGTVAVNSRTDCHVQKERKVCGNLSNGNWRLQRDNVSPRRRVHYN